MTFDKLFDELIGYNGVNTYLEVGQGDETYMGVSRNTHPQWQGWQIIDQYKTEHGNTDQTVSPIGPKIIEYTKAFYRENFYLKYNIHKIENSSVQEIIFDWCVNSGKVASQGVQKLLNQSFQYNLSEDGILGKNSLKAINTANPATLFQCIKEARLNLLHTFEPQIIPSINKSTIFNQLFIEVIKYEGYYANISEDRGGETYMGIARNSHKNWQGWSIIDQYKAEHGEIKHNTKINIPKLTNLVKAFYEQKFYRKNNIYKIKNDSLQEIIFDWCVNSGRSGSKGVQRVLNQSFNHNLTVDGILGTNSITTINNIDPSLLFNHIKEARIHFYHKIAERGQNHKFLKGWLNRINAIVYKE